MDKSQQIASVLAVCASILLAGMIIAYKPGMATELSQIKIPTGVSASPSAYSTVTALDTTSTPKTMSVSGTGAVNVKADEATIILGAYTEGKEASTAIDENAALMTNIIKALKELGLTDSNIETTTYTVYPNYNYEVRMVIGYQVTNLVRVEVTDFTKLGKIIDAASAAGANRIDSISFGLRDATLAQMKLDAYNIAIADVKTKSTVLASGLGVKIVGVQSISESSYSPPIYYDRVYAEAGKSSTPILSGSQSVTVTLNIVYLIESV
jgi:uncharacterized protein